MHFAPQVVRSDLGSPDAMIVETSSGQVFVVADHQVSSETLAALMVAAEYLPTQGDPPPVARRRVA